jgi:hypothetical protein
MFHARRTVALAVAALACTSAQGQQPSRPPISTYGVDVGTRTMSIPGMPAGGAGMMGGMMGGMGMGPQKELWLGLRSTHRGSGTPEAQHQIPPGMNMGTALPLLAPPPRVEQYDEDRLPEKPKARMLVYWGCGDTIRPGQPRVADTEKMTLQQFGQALVSRARSATRSTAGRTSASRSRCRPTRRCAATSWCAAR